MAQHDNDYDDDDQDGFKIELSNRILTLLVDAAREQREESVSSALEKVADDFEQREIKEYDAAMSFVFAEMMAADREVTYETFFTAIDRVILRARKKRAAKARAAQA